MQNKFNSDNYPTREPDELISGNLWTWTRPDITAVYPTATYTLKYRFNLLTATGTTELFTASKVSSAHVVSVGSNITSEFAVGDYTWQAIIVRDSDSEEVTVDSGYVEILADLGDGDVDTRSHNYITLKNIQAVIQTTATKEQESYTIAGRTLSRRSPEELQALLEVYERRWRDEINAKRRKSGRSPNNRVLVKMKA